MSTSEEIDWLIFLGTEPTASRQEIDQNQNELLQKITVANNKYRKATEFIETYASELLALIQKAGKEKIPAERVEEATGILNNKIQFLLDGKVSAVDFMSGKF